MAAKKWGLKAETKSLVSNGDLTRIYYLPVARLTGVHPNLSTFFQLFIEKRMHVRHILVFNFA